MVDAHTVDQSLGEPARHLGVGALEHRGILLTQSGQRGDREEPAIAARPVAPADQPVVLAVVHLRAGAGVGAGAMGKARSPRRRTSRSTASPATSSSEPNTGNTIRPSGSRSQSMSKNEANSESRPCRRTSHHHALFSGVSTPTWLGTMSTTRPRPRALAASDSQARPSAPPSSPDTVVGSVTS